MDTPVPHSRLPAPAPAPRAWRLPSAALAAFAAALGAAGCLGATNQAVGTAVSAATTVADKTAEAASRTASYAGTVPARASMLDSRAKQVYNDAVDETQRNVSLTGQSLVDSRDGFYRGEGVDRDTPMQRARETVTGAFDSIDKAVNSLLGPGGATTVVEDPKGDPRATDEILMVTGGVDHFYGSGAKGYADLKPGGYGDLLKNSRRPAEPKTKEAETKEEAEKDGDGAAADGAAGRNPGQPRTAKSLYDDAAVRGAEFAATAAKKPETRGLPGLYRKRSPWEWARRLNETDSSKTAVERQRRPEPTLDKKEPSVIDILSADLRTVE